MGPAGERDAGGRDGGAPDEAAPPADGRALPAWLAIALVAGTSACVLVLEILAGRLLAPYVGVSLETYTGIIGTVLAGIAAGAAAGGWAADRIAPRRLLPPLLLVGGALGISSIPIVRAIGDGIAVDGAAAAGSVILAAVAFAPSATVLSAVPPVVVKLQLHDLERTGSTVGRLSAWSTGGAIAGTFLAGFILVAYAAVTTLIVAVGLVLVAAGVALWFVLRPPDTGVAASAVGLLALSLTGVAAIDGPCALQTPYYCVSVRQANDRADGRLLVLDDLRHSYVALDDPTHLGFWYVRRIADAIDAYAPPGALEVVSIGSGGLTVPRWLRATRPGTEQVVLEIDPELVGFVERELGYVPGPDVDIRIGDGRLTMRGLPDDSADVVVGDAFGSRSVPWHLATAEFADEIRRVLRPGGIYVVNVIDEPSEDFLAAEAATLTTVFEHVHVMRSGPLERGVGGNAVILATDAPIDAATWDARRRAAGDDGGPIDDVGEYVDGAQLLTDDYAPVDQLILGSR